MVAWNTIMWWVRKFILFTSAEVRHEQYELLMDPELWRADGSDGIRKQTPLLGLRVWRASDGRRSVGASPVKDFRGKGTTLLKSLVVMKRSPEAADEDIRVCYTAPRFSFLSKYWPVWPLLLLSQYLSLGIMNLHIHLCWSPDLLNNVLGNLWEVLVCLEDTLSVWN